MQDHGTFTTSRAQRYLQQLAKHFAHKIEVRQQDNRAEFDFPFGTAHLDATETRLAATVHGSTAEELGRARKVIDDHLRRFAFREEFEAMDWSDGSA